MNRLFTVTVALGLAAGLAACGGRSSKTPPEAVAPAVETRAPITPPPMAVTRPVDIPLPPYHTLDLERTVMVGNDTEWLGRASMTALIEPIGVWEFYRREMPRQGWTEISVSESPNRVLFYQRGARVAVVEVWPGTNGSRVDVWMNPRPVSVAPVPAPMPQPAPPSAAEAAPPAANESVPESGTAPAPSDNAPAIENAPLPAP